MRKVNVRAPGGSYPVLIGKSASDELGRQLRRIKPSSVVLVTDRRVNAVHGAEVEGVLERSGLLWSKIVLPAGEGSKSTAQLERIWRAAMKKRVDRQACFVALGGGVIGDITGFAAASMLRGVNFIQMPTTLLAMVDASVGGKTGINLPEGKNLVGAFHQPRAVVMNLSFLETLPEREVRAGWAEIIKTAAIRDPALLRKLERRRDDLIDVTYPGLAEVIAACVKIKAGVVEEDERESGVRMILNFGHTFGHGIEAALGYGKLLHGEAVAIGMVFAARLGESLGHTQPGFADRLSQLIEAYGLPVSLSKAPASRILSAMARDKKRGPRGLRWVFVTEPGQTKIVQDVAASVIRKQVIEVSGG